MDCSPCATVIAGARVIPFNPPAASLPSDGPLDDEMALPIRMDEDDEVPRG